MITKSDFRTCRGILDAKVRIQIFQIKECEMWEVMWMFFCVSLLLLSLSSRLLSFEASYMCLTDLRALFHYYIPTPSFQAEFSARSLIAHDQLTAWIFMLKKEQLHGKKKILLIPLSLSLMKMKKKLSDSSASETPTSA